MRRQLALELWARFVCSACVAALLVVSALVLMEIDGWLGYQTWQQVCTEIAARVSMALGTAVVLSTIVALAVLPFVLSRPDRAQARYESITRLAAVIVLLTCGSAMIGLMILWSLSVGLLSFSNQGSIRLWALLTILLLVGTVAHQVITKRHGWTTAFSDSISGRTTRRLLLLAGVGSLLTGLSIGPERRPSASRRRVSRTSSAPPNILLVTFDALSAEDMSCYGYGLKTTPNIDSLAASSNVFSNYYASSNFTTPSIASMLTGRYPSGCRVYHYGGSLRGAVAEGTIPKLLRDGGYTTAASVANPGAHPTCIGIADDFDILPSPPLTEFATREVATLFRSAQLSDDVRRATNFVPYMLEQLSPRTFGQVHSLFPPEKSFQQASNILRDLPSPYFLWVHVFAPHFPYLPQPPFLRRFLPTNELRTHAEFADMMDRTGYTYSDRQQPLINKGRLRYNEWTAQADAAFGQFMASTNASGHLANTAVIVSADHGESFQGGYVGHGGVLLRRPVLHVPLLVHLPGQQQRRDISAVVDHTLLAPTLLGIAGQEPADWMTSPSMQSLLRDDNQAATSSAYAQYLAANNVFAPIKHGTVGVIDGRQQFVLDLDSGAGALYDLAEAHEQRFDRSAAEPERAAALREQIHRKFPDLFGGRAGHA